MCKAAQNSSPETQNLKQRFLNKSRHYPSTAPTQFSVVWNYWLVSLLTFSLDFVVIQLERNKMKKNIICTAFQNCSIYFTNSKHLKMHLQKNSVINTFPNADRKHSSAHSAQTANASFCAHMAWTEMEQLLHPFCRKGWNWAHEQLSHRTQQTGTANTL